MLRRVPSALTTRAAQQLQALEAKALLRRPPSITDRRGVEYRLGGQAVVGFCSNDYLGLSTRQTQTSRLAGAGASRLISGDLPIHRALEQRIAAVCGSDDTVLFPSGFQLNVGVIPALVSPGDNVFSDRLNHASIIDGLRLARSSPTVLPHGAAPPPRAAEDNAGDIDWWFTESIFSMDGDRFDATAMIQHQKSGGSAYVDDAHAFGLFPGGAGLVHDAAILPDVLVGTLSKAYGCAGAFVAATRPICDLIRNRARSFVFSTGVSPSVASDIAAHLDIVTSGEGDALRARLWRNVQQLGGLLPGPSPCPAEPPSPIFPVVIGSNSAALDVAARLLQQGFHVQAIRPPTVPTGTARLRVTVSAAHTSEQIQSLAHELRRALACHGERATIVAS